MNEYPKTYQYFIVSNSEGEQCVKDFYEWLDDSLEEYANPISFPIEYYQFDLNIKPTQLLKELEDLYNNEENWKELQRSGYDRANPLIRNWVCQISNGLTILSTIDMNMMNQFGERPSYDRICMGYQVYPRILRFLRCYTDPVFPHGKAPFDALKSILRQAPILISDCGIVEIIPFLAFFRPELVREECHPKIPKNSRTEINWNLLATLPHYSPELLLKCRPFMV